LEEEGVKGELMGLGWGGWSYEPGILEGVEIVRYNVANLLLNSL